MIIKSRIFVFYHLILIFCRCRIWFCKINLFNLLLWLDLLRLFKIFVLICRAIVEVTLYLLCIILSQSIFSSCFTFLIVIDIYIFIFLNNIKYLLIDYFILLRSMFLLVYCLLSDKVIKFCWISIRIWLIPNISKKRWAF